jgi:regulator of sigma E protease
MSLIAFIITIGILVTVHEFGHFIVARWCGVRVLKFSIGFGRPLWRYISPSTKTEWILAAIPLGGYVKMLDEREPVENQSTENASAEGQAGASAYTEAELASAFNRKSVWQRIAIVLAGPVANLLFAIVVYWGLMLMGAVGLKPILGEIEAHSPAQLAGVRAGDVIVAIDHQPIQTWQDAQWMLMEDWIDKSTAVITTQTATGEKHQYRFDFSTIGWKETADVFSALGLNVLKPRIQAKIGEVLSGSPAEKAGLKKDDVILVVNDKPIEDWQAFVTIVQSHPNQLLNLEIERAHLRLKLALTPETHRVSGKTVGQVGAAVSFNQKAYAPYLVDVRYGFFQAGLLAVEKTLQTIRFSFKMLGKILTGDASLQSISGPVSIAQAAGDSADLGIKTFLHFLALISISIAVMNLLPIPVLDGGHLLYYIAELIRGAPLPDAVMQYGQRIGMGLLGMLMLIAFINDINQFLLG